MNTKPYRKLILILLMVVLLFSNASAPLPVGGVTEAKALGPFANVVLGFFKSTRALNKRNRVYREAEATSEEINAYYDSLISRTKERRQELIKQVTRGEASPQMVRSYVRAQASLEAERDAAIQMIEGEKKQARKTFHRKLVKEIADVLIASPGGQEILGEVRDKIGQIRKTAVAIHEAVGEGRPIKALRDAFGEEVEDFQSIKGDVKGLGTAMGMKLNQALDNMLMEVEAALFTVQAETGQAVNLLDELDNKIAEYEENSREPVSLIPDDGPLGEIEMVDRANGVFDVAAAAYVRAAELKEDFESQEEKESMRDRVRNALLEERLEGIKEKADGDMAGEAYCTAVGRGEYETAAQRLGNEPDTPDNPENVVYLVCYDLASYTPIYASMTEPDHKTEGKPTETAESQPSPTSREGQIPHGSYTGEVDDHQLHEWLWQGMDIDGFIKDGRISGNQVFITVAEDGPVSGSLSSSFISDEYYDGQCLEYWEDEIDGFFEGTITESRGLVTLHITQAWTYHNNCPDGNYQLSDEKDYQFQVEIRVTDNRMRGEAVLVNVPDSDFSWSFTAEKP